MVSNIDTGISDSGASLVIVCWASGSPDLWSAAVASLQKASNYGQVKFFTDDRPETCSFDENIEVIKKSSLSGALTEVFKGNIQQVLLVVAPIITPESLLGRASYWISHDPRVGTVSFLSNSSGYLSFPHRNSNRTFHISSETADSLTRKLRGEPLASGPVHIAMPEGGIALIGKGAFEASGGFNAEFDHDPAMAIAEFGLRASRRGFFSCLDAATFVMLPVDAAHDDDEIGSDKVRRARLNHIHSFFPILYDEQRESLESPVALALAQARAKASGLRILIDGSSLGPEEMGTQVQTLSMISALAEHPGVQWVGVGIRTPSVPGYAKALALHPRIRLYPSGWPMFYSSEQADIIHRPFQPDSELPLDRWREIASRTMLTIQDVIAYRIGAYHASPTAWMDYRSNFRKMAKLVDGTFTITNDVMRSVVEEGFDFPPDRLFLAENGTDHLSNAEVATLPREIAEKGWAASSFVLILGTDYTHKNRDMGIKVWKCLRDRGFPLRLVLAGATMPFGSTRQQEARIRGSDNEILVMPDVTSCERNWLLTHAAIVLYPTSAEGFGLVPFEAARFGTPTLSVSFGPLREIGSSPSNMPSTWDLDKLVDAAAAIISSPAEAALTVKNILASGDEFTWKRVAERCVTAYLDILAKPRRQ